MAKKNEKHYPDPTPDRTNAIPSGWCMDGHHSGCRYQFHHGKCPCECHTKVVKNRGRPRKIDV